jgi:hypothetical protein
MKKWLAVAVFTMVASTGAVAMNGVVSSDSQVQWANGGGPLPPQIPCSQMLLANGGGPLPPQIPC